MASHYMDASLRDTARVTPLAVDALGSASSWEETIKAKNVRLVLLVLTAALGFAGPVAAQKSGGVLRIQHMDTPPSASIHEEATVSVAVPFMSLYNNLMMFDQHAPKNSLETVVPDLATKWEWKDGNTKLAFTLREGVRWHDGQPFGAKDVACIFDLLLGGESESKLSAIRVRRGGPTSRRSPPTAPPRPRSISRRRSPRCWRCSPRATHRSTPATSRPTRCGASRSAPARSSSPSSG